MKATSRDTGIPYNVKKETELRVLLDKLLKQECRVPAKWSEDIRKVKQKLELLDEERYRGVLVRARADDTAADEMASKCALGLENARGERNCVREIERDGSVLIYTEGITRAFTDHYRELFAMHDENFESLQNDFMLCLPRLDDELRKLGACNNCGRSRRLHREVKPSQVAWSGRFNSHRL